MVELKFQAEENCLSFKSQTGPDFALRCHFDRYAVNQSWLNWEGRQIRSDKGPGQFFQAHTEKNMNEQNTHYERKTSMLSVQRRHSSLPK